MRVATILPHTSHDDTDRDRTLPRPPHVAYDHAAFFVDIDGTMIDFAPRPDEVFVDPELPVRLRTLWNRLDGALAMLSGRPLREIDALVHLPFAAAGGLHGSELRASDGSVLALPTDRAKLQPALERATAAAREAPGLLVEDKGGAIALHFREAPQTAPVAQRAAADMLRLAGPDFNLLQGNCVIELKRSDIDKGMALAALMQTEPFKGRVPWMIGDDVTDEYAFDKANALGGVSIIVGARRPTCARYHLRDPAAARAWIAELAGGESA